MKPSAQRSAAGVPAALDPPAEDLTLAARIAAGDRDAFRGLMRSQNRRLFRLARSVLRDDAEAEDALQEAYLVAYRSIDRFRGDAMLSTWLARIVLNGALGRLRRAARRENVIPMVSSDDMDAATADPSDDPDQTLARTRMRALIERRLDQLPADFRSVFILRAVEEMSVEETAACLGIPAATVRSRHFRARSLLRESLARDIDIAERDLFEFGGARCDRIVAAVEARTTRAADPPVEESPWNPP